MIELQVEEYCQNCEEFFPYIGSRNVCECDNGDVICVTTIKCDKNKECSAMYKRITRFLKYRKDDEY